MRRRLTAGRIVSGWLACLAVGLGLPGCALGGPQLTPGAHFALSPVAVEAAVAPEDVRTVRLHGYALVPAAMKDLANVQDGKVTGSQVVVTSAMTGRLLAKGVTYYDGSFVVDVPLAAKKCAAIVAIDLVDRADEANTVTLQAPVVLVAGVDEAAVNLGPGSTALMAFLSVVARNQAETTPTGLGELIGTFEAADQQQFAQLAEASPEIRQVSTLSGFQSGIRQYVGRLTGRMGEVRKSSRGPVQVASK